MFPLTPRLDRGGGGDAAAAGGGGGDDGDDGDGGDGAWALLVRSLADTIAACSAVLLQPRRDPPAPGAACDARRRALAGRLLAKAAKAALERHALALAPFLANLLPLAASRRRCRRRPCHASAVPRTDGVVRVV